MDAFTDVTSDLLNHLLLNRVSEAAMPVSIKICGHDLIQYI